MRHYMVDPDNEERLLKVPPHVVAAIKNEAYIEAISAVGNARMHNILDAFAAIRAIEGLSNTPAFHLNTTNKDSE